MSASTSLPEVLRCRQRHAHFTPARRDDCDSRYYELRGFAKLAALEFLPPPRVLVQHFPGVSIRLDDTIDVVVFTAEQILPHEVLPTLVTIEEEEDAVVEGEEEVVEDDDGE